MATHPTQTPRPTADFLNDRVRAMPPSGIRRFFDMLAEMKDVISLTIGEPDFTTPEPITRAAIASLEAGETHYTANGGMLELRELIAADLETVTASTTTRARSWSSRSARPRASTPALRAISTRATR